MPSKSLFLTLITILALSSFALANQRPPFLIMKKIPHLSSMLKMHWNDPKLKLTKEQKSSLLALRKSTILKTSALKEELAPLEDEVATKIFANETPTQLMDTVEEIAQLKVLATKVHLECVYKTKMILTKKQLAYLLN